MAKLILDFISRMMDKILSARFIITVLFGVTYSHIVWHVVHAYLTAMKDKPELLEAFATGVFTGFSGLAVLVVKSYFDRNDRTPTQEDPNVKKTTSTVTTTAVTTDKPRTTGPAPVTIQP